MTVWFVPVTGEAVKQMSYAGPYGANLSPDGKSVVYLNFQHDPVDVHMVASDGQDTLCGSYASNEYPGINFMGWAPDSKSFLLNLSSDARLMDPYLCAAGKSPVKLTDTQHAYPVVWVDAERFLFISDGSLRLQRRAEQVSRWMVFPAPILISRCLYIEHSDISIGRSGKTPALAPPQILRILGGKNNSRPVRP